MPFNSTSFLIFFIIVYAIYRILPHRAQNIFLLIASYVFYGWWDIRFLFLIIMSTSLDFTSGLMINEGSIPKKQRYAVSSWVVLSAFFLLVVKWTKLSAQAISLKPSSTQLFSWKTGWLIFFAVVLITLIFNFFYGRLSRSEVSRRKRFFLILSITGNLSILCFFKYFNFFLENLGAIVRDFGLNPGSLHLNIFLPVGISFYTFMTMSYTIDVYRGKLAPTKKFHEYALFVAFFPKLLAGPIERAVNFLPQITKKRNITTDHVMRGLQQILYGLFKKIVIADGVAKTVSGAFAATYQLSWADAVVGTVLFTFQIYCDFSGYSDIAIGTANLLGFDLMRNFNFPYFARNPSEFWGRWHISLSSWFRDYVFFPLGGPYGSAFRWIRNVLVTFLLVGLWHGAAWNYILWGLYHGILLCLHRIKESLRSTRKRSKNPIIKYVTILGFFILTSLGWILFRAHSISQIMDILRVLVRDVGNLKLNVEMPTKAALLGFPVFLIMEFLGNYSRGKRMDKVIPMPIWTAACAAMIFLIILGLANVPTSFIYFVF
jgi:D-alanyl-lipoteichoic acid acyltransferase DltB (MBOAT superfamily)